MIRPVTGLAFSVALLISTGPSEADGRSYPAYFYCMKQCEAALDLRDPEYAKMKEAMKTLGPPAKGDGGKAFERFKLCNALCK